MSMISVIPQLHCSVSPPPTLYSLPSVVLIFTCDRFLSDKETCRLANAHRFLHELLAHQYTVKSRREWVVLQDSQGTGTAETAATSPSTVLERRLVLLPFSGRDSSLERAVCGRLEPSIPFGRVRDAVVLVASRTETVSSPRGYGALRLDELLPPSVTRLALDWRMDDKLEGVTFPSNLRELTYHTPVTDSEEGKIDEWHGGGWYHVPPPQLLTSEVHLRVLHLGYIRDSLDLRILHHLEVFSIVSLVLIPLTLIRLPVTVVDFRVNGNFPSDPSWIPPPQLQSLEISQYGTRALDGVRLPNTLKSLVYLSSLSDADLQALPRTLEYLKLDMAISACPELPRCDLYHSGLDGSMVHLLRRSRDCWIWISFPMESPILRPLQKCISGIGQSLLEVPAMYPSRITWCYPAR